MGFYWHAGHEEDREELRAFAMACATVGVPLLPVPFSDREGIAPDGKKFRRLTWYLESQSASGNVCDLLQQWESAAWRAANPESPMAVMWQFFQNWKAARAAEPDYAEWQFHRGDRTLSVPKSFSKDQIAQSLKKL